MRRPRGQGATEIGKGKELLQKKGRTQTRRVVRGSGSTIGKKNEKDHGRKQTSNRLSIQKPKLMRENRGITATQRGHVTPVPVRQGRKKKTARASLVTTGKQTGRKRKESGLSASKIP